MADLTNIARPYAQAAFNVARDKNQLAEWKAFFAAADEIAKNATVMKMVSNPETLPSALYDLYHGVLQSILTPEQANFLRLLAEHRRFIALRDIAIAYNAHFDQLEKISKVRVVTAVPASVEFQKKLTSALTKRIQRDVTLHCEIDPSIIGGAIIHMGDQVIDGSIRNKLNRLLESSLR